MKKAAGTFLFERLSRFFYRGVIYLDDKQRIELIQGFEMPMLSNCISMTRDGQYIFVTGNLVKKVIFIQNSFSLLGSYKPRVRCYDVNELSLKFERCFDNECIRMKLLSEDYSKVRHHTFCYGCIRFSSKTTVLLIHCYCKQSNH